MPKKKAVQAIKRQMERELMNDLIACGRMYATTVALLFARAEAKGMTKGSIVRLHFAALEELRQPFEEVLQFKKNPPENPTKTN